MLDQVRDVIRTLHYCYQTEQTYLKRIRRYIYFHNVKRVVELSLKKFERKYAHQRDQLASRFGFCVTMQKNVTNEIKAIFCENRNKKVNVRVNKRKRQPL